MATVPASPSTKSRIAWFEETIKTRFFCRFGAVLALAAPPGVATAQAAQSPAACAEIVSDSERLACYDRESGRTPDAPPSGGATVTPEPLPTAAEKPAARAEHSRIDAAWGFEPGSRPFYIDTYHQNYLLFARYTTRVNSAPYEALFQAAGQPETIDSTEAKFQISFKARLWTTGDRRWGAWGAYTQQNQWQVYNGDISRPFRETNYMPEVFLSHRPGIELGGFHWRLLNFGYNHQSNGRTDFLSRSWNRIYADLGVERGNLGLIAKVWHRINESASKDDNPDITDYYGYGSLTANYRSRAHSFSLMVRGNARKGKGAAQFSWMSPRLLGPIHGYVQVFTGYGESMIDYNWNQTTFGFGIALNDEL